MTALEDAAKGQELKSRYAVDKADAAFESSDLLRTLRERTEANRDKNNQAVRDKYCQRQAELGVGDCGGLRLIPGMTKSGVQKRPEWLDSLLGIESPPEAAE